MRSQPRDPIRVEGDDFALLNGCATAEQDCNYYRGRAVGEVPH